MIYSTKNIIQISFLVFTLSLVGCMRQKPHDEKVKANIYFGDNADFDLASAGGNLVPNKTEFQGVAGWNIPKYQTFILWADVRDTASRNSLRDFPFAIIDEEGNEVCNPVKDASIDPECRHKANADSKVVWTERIPYDHFKPMAEPVRVVRKIKGLGARRGERTVVFELNPWANSRKNLVDVRHVTFELSAADAMPLKDSGYRSSSKFRFSNSEESSELVIRNVTKQVYGTVEPILIGRSDKYLDALTKDLVDEDLIFSPFEPNEFVKRRSEANLDTSKFEPVSQIQRGKNNIYVYRQKNSEFPNIDGLKFDFTVLMNLGFRYPNLTEGFGISDISAGRFRVHAHLVLEPDDGSQPVLLTPGVSPLVREISRNNDLQLDYKAIVPYYPSSGMIKLALKIFPLGVSQGLKPLDRLYTVGPFNSLVGKNGGLIEDAASRSDQFNFNEYIQSAVDGEQAYKEGNVDIARDFHFDDLSIRFSTVEAGETAAQRTVIFKIETNVFDEVNSTLAGDNQPFEVVSVHTDYKNPMDKTKWQFFRITNAEHTGDPARTRRGRITLYDTITHKYYQTEELVERNIFIGKWRPGLDLRKDIESWALSASGVPDDRFLPKGVQRLKIYINPWDEKFGTFGQDARIASESFLQKVRGREKIPPRFFIGDFGYETLRFRYKIDKDMKLNVKKTVLLNLTPRVLRYSSILEGINSIYNLRDGIYLMKTAIQKDYLDPAARNEDDIFQIPYKLEGQKTDMKTQGVTPTGLEGQKDGVIVEAKNGEDSSVEYNEQKIINAFNTDGSVNPNAYSIPYTDPRRKTAMSMVKKLVRVNAGRVITPVEFSIEDLRLMRIRQQFFVQLEPINQVRLNMVDLVRKRFEAIFQIKLGEVSPILSQMSPQEQARIKSLMTRALDAVAEAVSDDVYITKIDDLETIIKDPKVAEAFQAFESAQFKGQSIDLRLKDILRQIKEEKRDSDTIHITDEDIARLEAEAEQKISDQKTDHANAVEAYAELTEQNSEARDKKTVLARQCEKLNPVEVYLDESKKVVSSTDKIDVVTRALIPFDTGVFEDDYSDKVSEFQPFEESGKQFFQSLITKTSLNKILTNDFTLMPGFSAVSNLDMLVDKDSGIKGRTFVGPMTFLYNTNRGSLRPTDNLDESYCETDDCNSLNTSIDSQYGEIQNYEYEKSPYHGSIAHFQNQTFNDQEIVDPKTGLVTKIKGLETMFNELQQSKKAYQKVENLLTRFLDYLDLSFVSLNDLPLDRLVCREDISSDRCYKKDTEKTVLVNDFINQYSETVNEVVNLDYKAGAAVELNFQKIKTVKIVDDLQDFSNISDSALPWGFISPRYGKGMDRCDVDSNNADLNQVCNSSNAHKRLGGLLGTSYNKEVAYVAPTKKELETIIRFPFKGNEMVGSGAATFTTDIQSKMCDLLVYGEIARKAKLKVSSEEDRLQLRSEMFDLSRRCQIDIRNGLSPLAIERRFRIFNTGRYYFLGGKSLNLIASRDVRLSTGLRVSRAFGVRPLRYVTGLIEKGTGFFSKALALAIGSLDFSYTLARDRTFAEGTGINQGTYLVMQNSEFEVELTSYEQCLVIRWSPDFVEKYGNIIDFSNGKFSEDYVRGLYLCSGVTENTPIAVNEKYYYFTQHFTEGDMLDPADIHNHPWLLALRGVREFSAFMLALTSFEKNGSDGYTPEYVQGEEMIGLGDSVKSDLENVQKRLIGDPNPTKHYQVTNKQAWPIHHMVTTYKRVLPTYPGTYTQLDDEDYNDRSWPWVVGEPGSVMKASETCRQ
jgi:hypothetical protein